MMRIKDIQDLQNVVIAKEADLSKVEEEYLSEAGKAALEAYRAIHWYASFAESLTELITNEDYLNLVDVEGKHAEYYRILKMVNKCITNIVY